MAGGVKKQDLRCGHNSGGVQVLMHALEPIARYDIVTPVQVSGGTFGVKKLTDEDTGAAFVAGHDQLEMKGDLEVYSWMLAPEGHPTTWGGHVVGVTLKGGVLLRPPVIVVPPAPVAVVEKPKAKAKPVADVQE